MASGTIAGNDRYVHFDEYKDLFVGALKLTRTEDGIVIMRLHTNDKSAFWTPEHHNGLAQLTRLIGQDPENEVLIITGTGEMWTDSMQIDLSSGVDALDVAAQDTLKYNRSLYDDWYVDGQDLLKNMIFDINIPTIGVINGPGCGHWEFAQACDLCICADDAYFSEPHFVAGPGFVPGDGQTLVYQHLLGTRRAAYLALTGKEIDAKTALDWGLVNEIMPKAKLMDRAMEMANDIMKRDRIVRRLTHDILRQQWKHALVDNPGFSLEFALECWGAALSSTQHQREAVATLMASGMETKRRMRENGENVVKGED